MKKLMLLLSIAAMLAMPMTMDASAQSHRHTPRTNANVTVNNNGVKATATIADNDTTTGVVAYSDTTSAAAADNDAADNDNQYTYESHDEDIQELREVMDAIGPSVFLPMMIVAIVFVVAPAILILIICYFLYKNRQQKLKLAEMAMKNGQPIPDSILGYSTKKQGNNTGKSNKTGNAVYSGTPTDDHLWRKGVMHIFVGIGLMFLLDTLMGNLGFSIGVLVTLYGAGQAFIAWTSNRNTNAAEPIVEEPAPEAQASEKPANEEPSNDDTTDVMEIYPDDKK
ncbi:MAG: DUF6249 domain-containing protein [Prevotella sp.]